MRVLHVLRDLSRNGGVQRLVHDLALAGPQFGWEVQVLVYCREPGPDYIDALRAAGVAVHCVPRWNLWRQRRLFRRADTVHAHLFPALYIVGALRPGSIYTEHNTTNNRRRRRWLRPLERWMYARFRRVTCISPEVQSALVGYLGDGDRGNTTVVYNGVDVDGLQERSHRARAQSRGAGFQVAMVGSFTPKKDQQTLVRAVARLADDVVLHLAGAGPCRTELEALVATLGLGERVRFHGVVVDVAAWLAGMDVHVQSSHWEGFGLAAIEAMACGLPSLCSDVPGLDNLCAERAILFAPGDDAALAALVQRVRDDAAFRGRLVDLGHETARRYSVLRMAQDMSRIYNDAGPLAAVLTA